MSATRVSLRKPDDTNTQDGLDVQIDWFDELAVLEDAINPPSNFSFVDWLFSDMMRLFSKKNPRIFSRKNFENYYFYFDYHNSASHKQAESLLEKYQKIAYHTEVYHFISKIETDNKIFFNDSQYCFATPKEIAKTLKTVDQLIAKA